MEYDLDIIRSERCRNSDPIYKLKQYRALFRHSTKTNENSAKGADGYYNQTEGCFTKRKFVCQILPSRLMIDKSSKSALYNTSNPNKSKNLHTNSTLIPRNNIRSIKQSTTNNDLHKNRGNVLNSSSSLDTARSSLPTILLRPSTINQNSYNLQSSVSNEHTIIPGSLADNFNNYLTTLQISQKRSINDETLFSDKYTPDSIDSICGR